MLSQFPCVQSLYREADCLYLLEEADTISSYEARAGSPPSSHESAMTAFSSTLDRVHQVEAIHREPTHLFIEQHVM